MQLLRSMSIGVDDDHEWKWKEGTTIEYTIKAWYNKLLNPIGGEH